MEVSSSEAWNGAEKRGRESWEKERKRDSAKRERGKGKKRLPCAEEEQKGEMRCHDTIVIMP